MGSKETKEKAKPKAAEAEKAKEAEARAKKETKRQAEKTAKVEDKKTSAELYKGVVTLSIMPPVDLGQIKSLEESLQQAPDLRLVLVGGSPANGTEMVISAENPIPLMDILTGMPPVAQVTKKGKNIQVTLKSE